ncbi:TPM domain-containing protein [Candidatus Saganbacteria bacterium]|nr:TPM domain-containing protein [Candidatus Saganbacteria bacterium]
MLIFLLQALSYALQNKHIYDNADILSGPDELKLGKTLSEYDKASDVDIEILTVKTLKGQTPSDHADVMYKSLKVGKNPSNS